MIKDYLTYIDPDILQSFQEIALSTGCLYWGKYSVERASAELNTGCHRYTMGGGGEVVVVNEQKASFQNSLLIDCC